MEAVAQAPRPQPRYTAATVELVHSKQITRGRRGTGAQVAEDVDPTTIVEREELRGCRAELEIVERAIRPIPRPPSGSGSGSEAVGPAWALRRPRARRTGRSPG